MICIKNLNIQFGDRTIIKNGSFSIEAGDHLQILGASGSGKSSILKALIKFIPSKSSEIIFENRPLSPDWINEYRQNFAYIGQKAPYFLGTVLDFLLHPFYFKLNAALNPPTETKINALLSSLGFKNLNLSQPYNSLSGGEQQRITIAQALLLKRKIYLLDEITSALDPTNTARVISIFSGMKETTFIVVSHDREWTTATQRQFTIKNQQIIEVKS